jgi:hypothetical protein
MVYCRVSKLTISGRDVSQILSRNQQIHILERVLYVMYKSLQTLFEVELNSTDVVVSFPVEQHDHFSRTPAEQLLLAHGAHRTQSRDEKYCLGGTLDQHLVYIKGLVLRVQRSLAKSSLLPTTMQCATNNTRYSDSIHGC